MAWRVARSLVVLTNEVHQLHPGTTVWTIGDQDHADEASDHNPNAADVVCAGDFLPDRGLNLHQFSRQVVASRHPALKYVIYNRQIWSKARASEGWRSYFGDNPHTGHAHVSVGVGPDGRSTGPYDDTSPWGLTEGDDVAISKDDANRVFRADGSIDAPTLTAGGSRRDSSKNPTWAGNSAIGAIYDNVARNRADVRNLSTEMKAGFAKAAAERAAQTKMIEALTSLANITLTPAQVDQLAAAVVEAGDGAAREILDRLEAVGEVLARDDDDG